MDHRTHAVGAIAAAYGLNRINNGTVAEIAVIPFYLGAFLGCLIPDIDNPKSKLGRIIFPISTAIRDSVGHRTFFHSLTFTALLGIYFIPLNISFGTGLVIGVLSHILLDILTPGANGVALLYPFVKNKMFAFNGKAPAKKRAEKRR